MVPVRLSWLVIWFVILSVRTFWIAGSWISGSTVATHRPVSETSLPAQTPSTETGASMQPRTMSTMETGVRQLKCRRRALTVLAAQRRYLRAESFHLSLLVRFLRARDVPAQLSRLGWARARRRLWITAGVRQYGHLLAAPAHGGHVVGSLGQRLIMRNPTLAQGPAAGLTHPG